MDEKLKNRLIEWVKNNYNPEQCGYNPAKSLGDALLIFYDGFYCGHSTAAYEIGRILGVELEKLEETKF